MAYTTSLMMKWIAVIAAATALLIGVAGFCGFDVVLLTDARIYRDHANAPLAEQGTVAVLRKGQALSVLDCIDDGNDVYFHVRTQAGEAGYLYETRFVFSRNWAFLKLDNHYFWRSPLHSLQCYVMLREFSRR